jgi:type IV fimbrial biogenesis protein FimT
VLTARRPPPAAPRCPSPAFRAAGFSLVETMIVLAVLSILLAIAVPSLREWMLNSQIRTKAEVVLQGLQLARTEAIRRNTRVRFELLKDGAEFTTGWRFGCATVTLDCPLVILDKPASEGGSAVALTTNAAATEVTFSGLGIVAAGSLSQVDLTTTAISAPTNWRVTVSSGGLFKLCRPAVTTAGDPHKC